MEKIARLISVAAIAMALIIAFSGVASASSLAEYYRMELTDVLAAYKIDAGGLKEGSMAKGRIAAGMSVFVMDGSGGGVGSILSYEEKSTASGLFVFHKVIDYTSGITPP
jgi:hypothetical protein